VGRDKDSIARVFLKDPAIVLFDEATSNLDSTTEQEIYKTINKLLINRTSLIITHRLSTIHNADKIAVIDKGELVDFGSHEELLEKSAFYKSLLGDFGFFLNKM
jgi:ABC-type multidrug transport system fused ATPase/permease subunit